MEIRRSKPVGGATIWVAQETYEMIDGLAVQKLTFFHVRILAYEIASHPRACYAAIVGDHTQPLAESEPTMTGNENQMLNQTLAQLSAGVPGRLCLDALDANFNLGPSDAAMDEIQRLEEASLTAEQRLGNFRVG